jgi:squalene-associated FAD-dependent desaturase
MKNARAAVVGGGLAGTAAAARLAEQGLAVDLFEARRKLGGRASSFEDPQSGELVDFCQHVSMACCTNLADFCRRMGLADSFRRNRTLHFLGPDGRQTDLRGNRWLPAPLHLAGSLWRLKYLSLADRWRIGRALLKLGRARPGDSESLTVLDWLEQRGQSSATIERFWEVVLVSALGESLDRISLAAAKKVFVDGFLANRQAYEVLVPDEPLGALYGERLGEALSRQGVRLRLGGMVQTVRQSSPLEIIVGDVSERYDFVVLALTWRGVGRVLDDKLRAALPDCDRWEQFESSPITGVHLWFDRPITELPHAVLVGRLSQWVFARVGLPAEKQPGHYYQVVISASRALVGQSAKEVVALVCDDLRAVFPAAQNARVIQSRVVTERAAVFSPLPGVEALRPTQATALPGLVLAGDWTQTGWPSTMEGAVRSGYLAAETVLGAVDKPQCLLVADLPRGWLARLLLHG